MRLLESSMTVRAGGKTLHGRAEAAVAAYGVVWAGGACAGAGLAPVPLGAGFLTLAGCAIIVAACAALRRSDALFRKAIRADEEQSDAVGAFRQLDRSYRIGRGARAGLWFGGAIAVPAALNYLFPENVLALCVSGAGAAVAMFLLLILLGAFLPLPRRNPPTFCLCWFVPVSPKAFSFWLRPWFEHSSSARFAASLAADSGGGGARWQPRLIALSAVASKMSEGRDQRVERRQFARYPLNLQSCFPPVGFGERLRRAGWSAQSAVPLALPSAMATFVILSLSGGPVSVSRWALLNSPPGYGPVTQLQSAAGEKARAGDEKSAGEGSAGAERRGGAEAAKSGDGGRDGSDGKAEAGGEKSAAQGSAGAERRGGAEAAKSGDGGRDGSGGKAEAGGEKSAGQGSAGAERRGRAEGAKSGDGGGGRGGPGGKAEGGGGKSAGEGSAGAERRGRAEGAKSGDGGGGRGGPVGKAEAGGKKSAGRETAGTDRQANAEGGKSGGGRQGGAGGRVDRPADERRQNQTGVGAQIPGANANSSEEGGLGTGGGPALQVGGGRAISTMSIDRLSRPEQVQVLRLDPTTEPALGRRPDAGRSPRRRSAWDIAAPNSAHARSDAASLDDTWRKAGESGAGRGARRPDAALSEPHQPLPAWIARRINE
jgi:hypothetical protein